MAIEGRNKVDSGRRGGVGKIEGKKGILQDCSRETSEDRPFHHCIYRLQRLLSRQQGLVTRL
jgi:hypothetical protein